MDSEYDEITQALLLSIPAPDLDCFITQTTVTPAWSSPVLPPTPYTQQILYNQPLTIDPRLLRLTEDSTPETSTLPVHIASPNTTVVTRPINLIPLTILPQLSCYQPDLTPPDIPPPPRHAIFSQNIDIANIGYTGFWVQIMGRVHHRAAAAALRVPLGRSEADWQEMARQEIYHAGVTFRAVRGMTYWQPEFGK